MAHFRRRCAFRRLKGKAPPRPSAFSGSLCSSLRRVPSRSFLKLPVQFIRGREFFRAMKCCSSRRRNSLRPPDCPGADPHAISAAMGGASAIWPSAAEGVSRFARPRRAANRNAAQIPQADEALSRVRPAEGNRPTGSEKQRDACKPRALTRRSEPSFERASAERLFRPVGRDRLKRIASASAGSSEWFKPGNPPPQ